MDKSKDIIKRSDILSDKDGKEIIKMVVADILRQEADTEITGKSKVSSKGQIVIPIEIRRAAGIENGGEELRCTYVDGKIIFEVEKHLSAEELFGILNSEEDEGDFVLDLKQAREERAEIILNKWR